MQSPEKQIALFGASGKSGNAFLTLVLQHNYRVKALIRNPDTLGFSHPNLTIIKGDVLHSQHVNETISGADVVVSLFGHVKGSPKWLQTEGTKHIITAMNRHQIKRIISLSGGGLPYPEKDQPKLADKAIRAIMRILVPHILDDAIAHYHALEQSGLDWTIVRAPRLTLEQAKGTYKVGWVGVNSGLKLSRADLAAFIFSQLHDNTFVRSMPFVSN